jgi:RNA polymerase sigma-70 factor (ECF subfamily)
MTDAAGLHASRRITQGDVEAFEQLMRSHNRMLFRTARAILRDDAEAEDALQEAYLRAYRAMGAFRGEAKLSTWLARIVANEALARRRKAVRRAEIVPIRAGVEQDELAQQADPRSPEGPADLAERRELRRLLEASIDGLSDSFRAVFVLRAVEGLSVEETAAALGLPEATVRTRFFRARGRLRKVLSPNLEEAFGFAGARCDRIVARVKTALAGVLLAASIAACTEVPQLLVPEGEPPAVESIERDGALRERTLRQGESGRMDY